MHAAADIRNRDRTLMRYLAGLNLAADIVPPGDDTAPGESVNAWLRVQVDQVAGTQAGTAGANHRVEEQVLVTVDVFCRGQRLGKVQVDEVDGLAGQVRSALTAASLPLLDLVADATGATTLAGSALTFHTPPTVRPLPAVSGVQRRQVLARAAFLHEV